MTRSIVSADSRRHEFIGFNLSLRARAGATCCTVAFFWDQMLGSVLRNVVTEVNEKFLRPSQRDPVPIKDLTQMLNVTHIAYSRAFL